MANWCSNFVRFEGTEEQIKQVDEIFEQMIAKEKKEEKGQLPNFINSDMYLFEIRKCEEGLYSFESRWTPPIKEILNIAMKLGIKEYEHQYEELGCFIFGKVFLSDNILSEYNLDDDDFESFYYQEDTNTYFFEDREYENDEEILKLLLDRKMKIEFPQKYDIKLEKLIR